MQLAYDGIAEIYASRNARLPDIYVELGLRFLALARPGRDVLDAGCGVGRDLAWLESQGCHMIGIDLSRGMLRLNASC
jgi:SAM-dependent methyltransferase